MDVTESSCSRNTASPPQQREQPKPKSRAGSDDTSKGKRTCEGLRAELAPLLAEGRTKLASQGIAGVYQMV